MARKTKTKTTQLIYEFNSFLYSGRHIGISIWSDYSFQLAVSEDNQTLFINKELKEFGQILPLLFTLAESYFEAIHLHPSQVMSATVMFKGMRYYDTDISLSHFIRVLRKELADVIT